MNRKRGIQTKHLLLGMTILCIASIILTITLRKEVSPIEKTIAYVVIPMQKGITSLANGIQEKVDFVQNINYLRKENRSLKKQLFNIQENYKQVQIDKHELERLRSLYNLDQKYKNYKKIAARIIGKDPGNWYNIFLIDKGTNDGIKVNMNVLAGNGLVGRVVDIGDNYAKVLSIIDDTSYVSAKSLKTSDLCMVKGDIKLIDKGLLQVENIAKNAKISVGDEIVTSHISDKFEHNILIGTIKQVNESTNSLTKTATIEPVVDFKHLQEVLVIVKNEK